jgi:DNA helicase-2/ATP-dependent DNA helicase PcrA
LLTKEHRNICVVGDEDQSIYGWRGASVENILRFDEDYSGVRVVRLEQNYRSTKRILDIANNVIRNNIGRRKKVLWTQNGEGEAPQFYRALDEYDEAEFVVRNIREMMEDEGRSFSDFVILYRINAQSRVFEDILRKWDIPYHIFGGLSFYQRKEIKDVLAYLRIISNMRDDVSLRRVINVPPRGVGIVSLGRIDDFSSKENISFFEAIKRVDEIDLPKRVKKSLMDFCKMLEYFLSLRDISISRLVKIVLERSGYMQYLEEEGTAEAKRRVENIEELLTVIEEFEEKSGGMGGLNVFLEGISLTSDVDSFESNADKVTLMTLHNAKGLEFPIVFMVGMEEWLFPHLSATTKGEIEEERRLCYVGMTRAKEKLFLSCASRRKKYGNTIPSRFLKEANLL